MKRVLTFLGALLLVAVSMGSSSGGTADAAAEREKERQRILAQHLEADAVVGKAVLALSQHKDLDPMEKAQLASAVRDLEQTAQSYRRMVW
jgi:hypothetical protein